MAIQMKNHVFKDKRSLFVINILTDFKRVCDSPSSHECAGVGRFRHFMTGGTLVAIKALFTLSSRYVNMDKEPPSHMQRL